MCQEIMSIPRIYQNIALTEGDHITLGAQGFVHLAKVLRLKQGDAVVVFNGQGGEFLGHIVKLQRRCVAVRLDEFMDRSVESPLSITLVQGISRRERMDYTVQKAVELGVTRIIPVNTERTTVNLKNERRDKKRRHWGAIVESACEQCGRNRVPEVAEVMDYHRWVAGAHDGLKLVLSHRAQKRPLGQACRSVTLLVGPEGGLSEFELETAECAGFAATRFGPRILRTETAALVAMAVLQHRLGDC